MMKATDIRIHVYTDDSVQDGSAGSLTHDDRVPVRKSVYVYPNKSTFNDELIVVQIIFLDVYVEFAMDLMEHGIIGDGSEFVIFFFKNNVYIAHTYTWHRLYSVILIMDIVKYSTGLI